MGTRVPAGNGWAGTRVGKSVPMTALVQVRIKALVQRPRYAQKWVQSDLECTTINAVPTPPPLVEGDPISHPSISTRTLFPAEKEMQ